MSHYKRLLRWTGLALAPMVAAAALLVSPSSPPAKASSHREAPLIAFDAQADTTDVYAFIDKEAPNAVTLVANWLPISLSEGGPNYTQFSDDVLYSINIDNDGDADADISYQFRFKTTTRNPNTFLYNVGPITAGTTANPYPNLNVTQVYSMTEVRGNTSTVLVNNGLVPPVNIGSKSTPNYESLVTPALQNVTNSGDQLKVFVGPRDDPFFVDLGSVFDLLTLRGQMPPVGYASGPTIGVDGLSGYNVHSAVIQVPISRVTQGSETVIGVWATSSRQTTCVRGTFSIPSCSGNFVQVSRLGMPLVNEVVMPRALKDAFNSLSTTDDNVLFNDPSPTGQLLKKSVLDPELQNLLQALYGVPNPGNNRTDLVSIFLTGMKLTKPFTITTANGPVALPAGTNVNQPANVVPAEMLRLNTAPAFRPGTPGNICAPTPNYKFGILGGDACGFPNGRRLQDDVTDISLFAVGGAAFSVLTPGNFNFNPALLGVLTDSVSNNDMPFKTTFPYLATPHQGQEHYHQFVSRMRSPMIMNFE